jgi:hypothetical protein
LITIFFSLTCEEAKPDDNDLFDQFDVLVEPDSRTASIAPPLMLSFAYKNTYRSGVSSVFATDVEVSPAWYGFGMHIVLNEIISLKASQLQEAGLLSKYIKQASLEDFRMKPEEIGPQVLNLRHLEAGFVVICVLLGVSVVAFSVECASKLMVKLLDMCMMCCVVVKFTRMNKML